MEYMRKLLNIVESKELKFFHGSRNPLKTGVVLLPQNNLFDNEEILVEYVLEKFRPKESLPRHESVYMVDKPDADLIDKVGGYSAYIYEVEPAGKVEKNDVSWWNKIYQHSLGEDYISHSYISPILSTMARNYWAGVASDKPSWEYRSKSAIIKNKIN